MDFTTQILLTIMITVLGITLTLVGVQLFFVLKELQKSVQRINGILDDTRKISQNLSSGTERVSQVINDLVSSSAQAGSKLNGLMSLVTGAVALKSFFKKNTAGEEVHNE